MCNNPSRNILTDYLTRELHLGFRIIRQNPANTQRAYCYTPHILGQVYIVFWPKLRGLPTVNLGFRSSQSQKSVFANRVHLKLLHVQFNPWHFCGSTLFTRLTASLPTNSLTYLTSLQSGVPYNLNWIIGGFGSNIISILSTLILLCLMSSF